MEELMGIGRKVVAGDVTPSLRALATRYVREYTGSFSFVLDIKRRGMKSDAQVAGILNCIRSEAGRNDAKPEVEYIATAPRVLDMPVQSFPVVSPIPVPLVSNTAKRVEADDMEVGRTRWGKKVWVAPTESKRDYMHKVHAESRRDANIKFFEEEADDSELFDDD